MEDSEFSHPDLPILLENFGNNICADCKEKNPRWSSVNNGIFICSKCARIHKTFNNNISIIKSIEADLWDDNDINYIKKGGNMRFNNMMTEYNIPKLKDTIIYKYHTKIADYYRKLLYNEVNGLIINFPKPSLEEGMLKIGYGINNMNNNLNNINNNMSENNNFNNPYIGNRTQNTIGQDWNNVIFSMGKVINSVSSQIKSKMKDYKIDEKLNRANDYLYEKKEKITHSEIFQNMKNKAENGIQIIKEKASGFYNIHHPNINENFNEDKSSDI